MVLTIYVCSSGRSACFSRLSAILLVLPTDEERTLSPGYLDYENEARRLRALRSRYCA